MKQLLVVALAALVLPTAALAWGGTYPTGDALGTSVRIEVSSAYPVDETLPQSWATYLGTIAHGPELAKLTLDLVPLSDVQSQAFCGSQALACYDPGSETIYVSPEDQLNAPPAKELVTHEYGHHLANNRSDAPWSAVDYGTKRWASYENICAKTAAGTASPGNEGAAYGQNPGEGFAEAYRVLSQTALGQTSTGWDIVSRAFYPDATALRLLQEDITTPWTGPTVRHVHGFFGFGTQRTIGVQTSLDGSFAATLHAPSTSRMRLALYSGKTLLARGRTVRFEVCGQRALTLKVERLAGAGAFTVDISKP